MPNEALAQLAQDKLAQLAALLEQERHLQYKITRLREYIEKLNPLLQLEGLPEISSIRKRNTGFAKPGNKNAKTPPRKALFDGMSLSDGAVLVISQRPGHDVYIDTVAEEIFDFSPSDSSARNIVKRSLGTSLANAVKEGRLIRVRPGYFSVHSVSSEHQNGVQEWQEKVS